jgi:hypothetical protein
MGRIGHSFQLVGQSYRMLMQDKELMVLPLMSGVIIAFAVVTLGFGFGLHRTDLEQADVTTYVPIFFMYVVTYTIGIFFQAAVVAGATERMRGGDPTVVSALSAAGRRIVPILMWAIVAATVGMLLRAIQERVGFIGRIIAGLLGAAWSLATLFVVPVIVLEDRSIGHSISRSVGVFKKTWGETMVGNISLGAAALCAWVTLVAVTGLLAYVVGIGAVVVFVVGGIALMIFFSAMEGIYLATLFRYATEGEAAPGFDKSLLEQAFVPKDR